MAMYAFLSTVQQRTFPACLLLMFRSQVALTTRCANKSLLRVVAFLLSVYCGMVSAMRLDTLNKSGGNTAYIVRSADDRA